MIASCLSTWRPRLWAATGLFASILPTPGAQIIWDGGNSSSMAQASGQPLPLTLHAHTTGSDIIGGERDLSLVLVSANNTVSGANQSNALTVGSDPFFGGSYIDVAHGNGVGGTASVVWDGLDNSELINYTGLGGVNLSAFHTGIEFNVVKDGPPAEWAFEFYTSATQVSIYTLTLNGPAIDLPGNFYSIPFSSFTPSGTLGGADFSNIGAISITVKDASTNGGLDSFISGYKFTPVPEPRIGILIAALLLPHLNRSKIRH